MKQTDQTIAQYATFNSMTRKELRQIAKDAGIPRGSNKKNTVANLVRGIADKKLRFSYSVTIATAPTETSLFGLPVYKKNFRSFTHDVVTLPVKKPDAATGQ